MYVTIPTVVIIDRTKSVKNIIREAFLMFILLSELCKTRMHFNGLKFMTPKTTRDCGE